MTEPTNTPEQPSDEDAMVDATGEVIAEVPLDRWMLDLAREAVDELEADVVVPREMMWARIAKARQETSPAEAAPAEVAPAAIVALDQAAVDIASARRAMSRAAVSPLESTGRLPSRWGRWSKQIAAVAAVLVTGVAIGRYMVPAAGTGARGAVDTVATSHGIGPDALAAMPRSNDPTFVAMQEHLAHTVTLLTTVRDDDPPAVAEADLTQRARDLLVTTRLLLDQPQLRDERTRRLLQDLELVLLQVIQARGSAPETQLAPKETMRETNLITRVRALVTASAEADDVIYGGD